MYSRRLTNNPTHFTMENWFNDPITLPDTLLYLTMGIMFNKPLILPNNLLCLVFGESFNQPIQLPDTLLRLEFNPKYEHHIVLPDSLLYLSMGFENVTGGGGGKVFSSLKVLPKKLRFLACSPVHICNFTIPETLETIVFTETIVPVPALECICMIDRCMDNMPNSVTTIVLNNDFYSNSCFYANIPNSIKYIVGKNIVHRMANGRKVCRLKKNIQKIKVGQNDIYVLEKQVLFEIMSAQ